MKGFTEIITFDILKVIKITNININVVKITTRGD